MTRRRPSPRSDRSERHTAPTNPERSLWAAVIAQAVSDATDGALWPAAQLFDDNGQRIDPRQDAISWIFRTGAEFEAACDHAGVDADAIRSYVERYIDAQADLCGLLAA